MNYQRNPIRIPTPEPQSGRRPMGNGCGGNNGCGCCERGGRGDGAVGVDCLHGMSLAMVYSPCQEFEDLYDHTEGLRRGTIFRQLDKPFTGRRGGC